MKLPDLSTIADLPKDPNALRHVLTTFNFKTDPEDRKQVLTNHKWGTLWFSPEGILHGAVLPGLIPTTDDEVAGLLASFSGSLVDSSPIVLDYKDYQHSIVGVGNVELARSCKAPHLKHLQNSPNNAKDKEGKSHKEALNFVVSDPCFVMVPKYCLLLPGFSYPLGLDATKPVPDEVYADLPEPVKLWIQVHNFAFMNNNGNSLWDDDSVIGNDYVPLADFQFNDTKIKAENFSLTKEAGYTFIQSAVGSQAYTGYKTFFRDTCETLAKSQVDLNNLPAGSSATNVDHVGIIQAAIKEARTSADQSPSDSSERILWFYRILFGKIIKNDQGQEEFALAELSDHFIRILTVKKIAEAYNIFQDYWVQQTRSMNTTRDAYDSRYDWNPQRFHQAVIAAIRAGRWVERSVIAWPADLKNRISFALFVPSDCHDKELTDLIHEEATSRLQEEMGEDATKRSTKSTTFFIKGRCTTLSDVSSTIANFAMFSKFSVKDFNMASPPFLVKQFDTVMLALCSRQAKEWESALDLQQIPVTFIQELNVVLECVANVSRDICNTDSAKAGTLTNPKLFYAAELQLETFTNTLQHAMQNMRKGNLTIKPALAQYISTTSKPAVKSDNKDKDTDKKDKDQANKRQGTTKDSNPTKKSKNDIPNSEKGILECKTNVRRKPIPDDFTFMRNGQACGLCDDFLYRNCECTKKNCPLYHMTKRHLDQLETPRKVQFCTFVDGNPNIEFAPGMRPSTVFPFSFPIPTLHHYLPDCRVQAVIGFPTVRAFLRPITKHFWPSTTPAPDPSPEPTEPPPDDDPVPTLDEVIELLDHDEVIVTQRFRHLFDQGDSVTPTFPNKEAAYAFLRTCPSRARLAIESPYGKDSVDRCFMTERTFKNVYIFLFKGELLSQDDLRIFFKTCPSALVLWILWKKHELVDFSSLRSPLPTDLPPEQVIHRWSRMFTACLLHYNLDVASAVRYVGGVHTGSHRDWEAIEPYLRAADLDDQLVEDLRRVLMDGCPNYVNAYSTEANRLAYAEYGNHPSVYRHADKTIKAVQKDFLRSHNIPANPALGPFLPDTQTMPQGLVVKPDKNDRQICDGSFHPNVDSIAVNDMTSKETEHEVIFPRSFFLFLAWIYNLRISYPTLEIYICDDDVSGAFRHGKWNPNVVGMHAFMIFGFLFFCTGLTFGDTTCPANWEIIAICRGLLAAYLWTQTSTVSEVSAYLPEIETDPLPTDQEIANFTPAERDSLNTGVCNPDGSRRPPTYDHHVDDCLYADTGAYLLRTISASVLALYIILGFPDPEKGVRDCVSWDKFTTTFSHTRETLGWAIDSRALTVSLPESKRETLLRDLNRVLQRPTLTLQEIAKLLGQLSHATTVCRHMKCSYFNLQRLMRTILVERFRKVAGYHKRRQIKIQFARRLPSELQHRLDGLVSKHMARLLWSSHATYTLGGPVIRELKKIVHSLRHEEWKIYIPQLIPRDHHFESFGDASLIGGGAFSTSLGYWFRLVWSERVVAGTLKSVDEPGYIHINTLEYLVAFLQAVAAVVLFESGDVPEVVLQAFPSGFPAFPIVRNGTDNTATKSWLNDSRTNSPLVRALVDLQGQLLKRNDNISEVSLDEKLAMLPPECRPYFRPAYRAVMQLESGPPKTSSESGTVFAHQVHFLRFLRRMNISNEDLLLESFPHGARTMILASFAADLAQGNTWKGKAVRAATIEGYLRHVSALLTQFYDRDPRFDKVTDQKMSPSIHAVLTECRRYEKMPNRRDPYNLEMHDTFRQLNRDAGAPFLGLNRACEDWFCLGLYIGPRLQEWGQDDDHKELDNPAVAPNQTLRAFTLQDIRLFDARGRPVSLQTFLDDRDSVSYALIIFSWQKNLNLGEERRIDSNIHSPERCGVTALRSILKRFALLVGIDNTTTPLAVFKGPTKTLFIHSQVINKTLRQVAKATYSLSDTELNKHYRYTSHSLRVGACVLLHAAGVNATRIKFLLRWKSDSFMFYLRNVAHLSACQNQAFLHSSAPASPATATATSALPLIF